MLKVYDIDTRIFLMFEGYLIYFWIGGEKNGKKAKCYLEEEILMCRIIL